MRLLGIDGIEVGGGRGRQRDGAHRRDTAHPAPGAADPDRAARNPSSRSSSGIPTNGAGTYPAGRFVSLVPAGGGRYRLDFNRARNPFCAYSSAYACPAPWHGNTLPAAGHRREKNRWRRPAGRRAAASRCGRRWRWSVGRRPRRRPWRGALDLAGRHDCRFGLEVDQAGAAPAGASLQRHALSGHFRRPDERRQRGLRDRRLCRHDQRLDCAAIR